MPAMNYDGVAHLYDAYVRPDLDVPFFRDEAHRAGGPVLELMCGTGRVSLPLLKAGIDLTCVDSSGGMLDVFRGKLREGGLSTELIEADVCELCLDRRFDQIFIPFHSFAEIIDPAQQRQALRAIRAHLSPTGRFICTLHNPPVRLKSVTGRKRKLSDFALAGGPEVLSMSSVEHYDTASSEVTGTQFYEVRDSAGAVLSEMEVPLRFRLHTRESFEVLVTSEGFARLALYGDYVRAPFEPEKSPFIIWILRKT